MNRISIKAVVIAFIAELGVSMVIGTLLIMVLGRGMLSPDLSEEELTKITETILGGSDYLLWSLVFSAATTIGGGYLAARIAREFPYYNGLAIGVVGIVFGALFWAQYPWWLSVIDVLITIPASIYGAHVAKRHMSAPQ